MMQRDKKNQPTIGCCGIDCGLCPRYYTEGKSRCPGCFGPQFPKVMGQTCSFITCCVKKNGLETCGECDSFPCSKFKNKWFGDNAYDSFVTHKKALANVHEIKQHGLPAFLKQQRQRISILNEMLDQFNDGRSKNFYCLSCALLSIDGLKESMACARDRIKQERIAASDFKVKAKSLRMCLEQVAKQESVELRLHKPPQWK